MGGSIGSGRNLVLSTLGCVARGTRANCHRIGASTCVRGTFGTLNCSVAGPSSVANFCAMVSANERKPRVLMLNRLSSVVYPARGGTSGMANTTRTYNRRTRYTTLINVTTTLGGRGVVRGLYNGVELYTIPTRRFLRVGCEGRLHRGKVVGCLNNGTRFVHHKCFSNYSVTLVIRATPLTGCCYGLNDMNFISGVIACGNGSTRTNKDP